MAWAFWPDIWYLDVGVLLIAVALDLLLPEPPNAVHPVVWMGKLISLFERMSPKSGKVAQIVAGLLIALAVPAIFGAIAWLVVIGLLKLGAIAYLVVGAVMLKTTFSLRGLQNSALDTKRALESDISEARDSLLSLVSRDASTLTPSMITAAAIESVAENSTDSYVGPWIAFALLGVPGAFVYRAINTLDSMLGYHGRYEYLGKASARIDDVVNLLPARISAIVMLMAGAVTRFDVARGLSVLIADRGKTESPNAGWTMSTMAGLLGISLEKPGHYRLGGALRDPEPSDIGRSVRIGYAIGALGVALAIGLLWLRNSVT